MPIVELRTNDLDQQCAVCGATRTVALAGLSVGVEIAPGMSDSSVITLPACPGCSAQEFLIRTASSAPPGHVSGGRSGPDLHAQLVRALYAALVRDQRLSARSPTEIHESSL